MGLWGHLWMIILSVFINVQRSSRCDRHHSLSGILDCVGEDRELNTSMHPFFCLSSWLRLMSSCCCDFSTMMNCPGTVSWKWLLPPKVALVCEFYYSNRKRNYLTPNMKNWWYFSHLSKKSNVKSLSYCQHVLVILILALIKMSF